MRALLASVLVAVVAVSAADGYRNPTAGRDVVLQIPGMHRAKVRRGLVYGTADGGRLRLDVYRSRRARGRLPAVLLGGPPGAGRTSGQKVGWAQLIAASGMAAVAFDIRSDNFLQTPAAPAGDVAAALGYVRARAAALGVDPDRLCTLGFSIGTAPWHLWATMRDPQPFLRCNAVLYGPLDLEGSAFAIDPSLSEEYSALTWLRRHGRRIPPMLIVKAGREHFEGINESIDRFEAAARELNADVRVLTHRTGAHGFDVGSRTRRSRALVRETLRFLRSRLTAPLQLATPSRRSRLLAAARPRPLRLRETCVTKTERRRVVRFRAADGVRLIGVLLGRGPRGVVLAHQGGGAPPNLCSWMWYARRLAAGGYRVLAFDHRNMGSSARTSSASRAWRVDLDVVGAAAELRRRGATSLVLAGASLGGSAVLAASARIQPAVQGVISVAAPEVFVNVDALAAVRRSAVPSLFVSAAGDADFPEAARRLFEASVAPDKRLAIVPGSRHGAPVLRNATTRELVTGWIASHSASPTRASTCRLAAVADGRDVSCPV